MIKRYRINIRSRTDSLTLSHYSVCRLLDGGLVGFDSPEASVITAHSAFADGGHIISRGFKARVLSVYFEVTDRDRYPEVRDTVMRLTDPHEDVTVTAYVYGRRRTITATPAGGAELIFDNFNDYPRIRLRYLCENPFFTERELSLTLPVQTPLFTFPLNLMGEAGTAMAMSTLGYSHKVYNPGDVECGFVATVMASHGDVHQPFVMLNGKRLQYMGTLREGDVAVFDTSCGKKRLTVNGTISYNFGKENQFFGLRRGENPLYVSASSGASNLTCEVRMTPLYLGI